MKTVYFDCIGGASGNMLLASLIDAGAGDVLPLLQRLPVSGWSLEVTSVHRQSLGATHVNVRIPPEHHHRHLSDIRGVLRQADLPEAVEAAALRVFERLAEAEARVHRMSVDEVHFHEVGAVDAIVDVVGTVAALHGLGVSNVTCSPLPVGHGLIHCQHGTFPNPAPATAELLRDVPSRFVDVEAELVTPTGAALLTGLNATFGGGPPAVWSSIGYGAGTRDLPFPNVVRAFVGALGAARTQLLMLETNIDDSSPQIHGALMDQLLAAGALDVTLTPMMMKKNRPAVLVSVLCDMAHVDAVRDMLLTETTTLGVRQSVVERYSLPRREASVATPYGIAAVKLALGPDGAVIKVIPEYEDCLRLARDSAVPLQRVLDEVRHQGWQLK